jgi:uncharacterized iron-regulated membrane protein
MNRIIHRIGALLAVLLMLWLAGTGTIMQVADLKAVMTHAPATDHTVLSMIEGMYGPGNFMVIQMPDFSAAALPKDFDIKKAMGTVMQAADAPQGTADEQEGDKANPTTWIELRVVDGAPIGQVMKGNTLEAFSAQTGEPITAVPAQPIPQAAQMPPSLRDTSKVLHRFWNRRAVPGVYFEMLSGVVMLTLLITGLVMYFRLLSARARIGRRQWFWFTGGMWRGLHRAVSVFAAVFLLVIAVTGTWIGYDASWGSLGRPFAGPTAAAVGGPQGQGAGGGGARGGGGGGPARNRTIPIRADEVQSLTATTLDAMQRLHPGTPIKAIRLRTFGTMKQGVVISGGEKTEQLIFDAATGKAASLTEPTYPRGNFPFGVQVHENVKHIHSGEMFGLSGQFMSLFAGLSLLFLSISGVTVYIEMWLHRRAAGRGGFFWK